MKRLVLCFSLLSIFFMAGCDRRWNEIIIKKRSYMDGYYVHIPSKRSTDPQENPKPSPYPTGTVRTGIARTGFDTAAVADQPGYTPVPDSTPGPAQGTSIYTYNNPAPYGYPSGGNGQTGGTGTGPGTAPFPVPDTTKPSSGFVNQNPVPQKDSVPTGVADQSVPKDSLTPDSLVAQQDSVVPPDSLVAKQDKPRKHRHIDGTPSLVVFAGLLSPQQDYGYPVKWNSFGAGGGIRYTMKVKKKDRIVVDATYRLNQFYIGQERRKMAPLTVQQHDRERVTVNDLSAALCTRIHFESPEGQPKRWLDIGFYGDRAFRTSNVYIDKRFNTELADREKVKTKFTGLHYMSDWDYGFTLRFKHKQFNFFTMYRISDLIENHSQEAYHRDLPRLMVGLEWNPSEE